MEKFLPPLINNELLSIGLCVSKPIILRITASHAVVMLLGDNLADFSFLFDVKNSDERLQNVNALSAEFGNRFIILSNSILWRLGVLII